MPAYAKRINGKWRVADDAGIVKNKAGTPVDGKGHSSKADAEAQARAINANSK